MVAAAFFAEPLPLAVRLAGLPMLLAGGGVVALAARELGRALTPLPEPRRQATLVDTGPYRIVRHPIYAGALLFLVGFGLLTGPLPLLLTVPLAVLWAAKAREEERRLLRRFPSYAAYRYRTRRLFVPGLF